MLTVCPNCHTRFRVLPAQLKAAHGQVRCGKCETVFDAFAGLEDESPDTRLRVDPTSLAVADPGPELPVITASRDLPAETSTETDGDAPPAPEAPLPPGPDEPAPTTSSRRRAGAPAIDDLFADLLGSTPTPEPSVPVEPLTEETAPRPDFPTDIGPLPPSHHEEAPRHPWRTAGWSAGAALLLLALGAQIANAHRMQLSDNLVLGASVRAFYAAIGDPLPPPRDASAWDVDEVNVTSDPHTPGILSITGNLESHTGLVQPWPLLRVELTDRYGAPLRGRDFKPDEYLPATQVNVLLAPGMATRFRIDIADPGPDAVGFSVLPCLETPSGQVCATTEHD